MRNQNSMYAYVHNTVLGVVNRRGHPKSMISSICGPYLALQKQRRVAVFDVSD